MSWKTSESGHQEFVHPDGERMRILPPAADSKYPRWTLQDRFAGDWQDFRKADSEAAARSLVEDICQHRADVKKLERTNIHIPRGKRIGTPWGSSQGGTKYAEGIESHDTAGHGGFKLSAALNRQIHSAWRRKGGWYEEDCDWAIVAHTFPQHFTAYERKLAEQSLKRWMPHEYMAVTGKTVDLSESFTLREEIHAREHANDWMAISAISSESNPGMVVVTATIGGKREAASAKDFLVPAVEYEKRNSLSFVIDPSRHAEYEPLAGPHP
jgi:predicted heme/steroid binding protein